MSEQLTTSEAIFSNLSQFFQADATRGMNTVYQFDITGDGGGQWSVEINDGTCKVEKGTHPSPKVTFTMSSPDHVALFNGQLNPQMAFMTGKLKVKGDIGQALKFSQIFKR
jgi:putative sterol carrier protein